MRVVHLAYYYGNTTSGAPVSATRLHQSLLRADFDSHFICVEQKEPGKNVHSIPRSRVLERLFYLLTRGTWVLSKLFFGKIVMANLIPRWGFSRERRRLKPDVVHVHLISQDMVSFSQLMSLPCSMVVTLHDFTLINALDPHPQDDDRYREGFTRENSRWIERWVWNRKREFIAKAHPLFSAPSHWAASVFQSSRIGHGRSAEVIPNLADPVFRFDPTLRSQHSKFRIIFGAFKGRSVAKGWDDLVSSLDFVPESGRKDMEIRVFGEKSPSCVIKDVRVEFLGAISNAADLMRAYHQADICAFPSRRETQGQVKSEALLCGLPVLAFDRTACAEGIGPNGWIASDGDLCGYAEGLVHYYRLSKNGSLENLRSKIAADTAASVSEANVVDAFISLYEHSREGEVQ